ncbi:hypothetical protein ACFQT0_12690 [Hymenobacter humi]|uniref:Lipoprotein n=1 Tax=Hymenobacter humi TaxID=1411620 RepID=A0ABW2U5P1_9BACT
MKSLIPARAALCGLFALAVLATGCKRAGRLLHRARAAVPGLPEPAARARHQVRYRRNSDV